MSDKRAVCLNCIDGRVQLPVVKYVTKRYEIDFVDMITEPGMDGLIADAQKTIDHICDTVRISIEKNNAQIIFLVAHHDCRGNPVHESVHKQNMQDGIARLKKTFPNIPVKGLWVNAQWMVEKI